MNRLILFGNERLATATKTTAPVLQALINHGYKIEAVVASHSDAVSRQKRDIEVALVAGAHNIPVLFPAKLELKETLKNHPAEACILIAFGQLVPQSVIDLFPRGIINIHPSLLPKLRGSTPLETTILESLPETGVSLMQLTSEMDAGPVYAQTKLKLSGAETKQELADKLARLGTDLLIKHLPDILSGNLQPLRQDDSKATFTKKIGKKDGQLDFTKSAVQLEREIRAYAGWPQSRTTIWSKDVIITRAHSVPSIGPGDSPGKIDALPDIGVLMIYAKDGYLCIDKLKPSGKGEMSAAEFIRGYKP